MTAALGIAYQVLVLFAYLLATVDLAAGRAFAISAGRRIALVLLGCHFAAAFVLLLAGDFQRALGPLAMLTLGALMTIALFPAGCYWTRRHAGPLPHLIGTSSSPVHWRIFGTYVFIGVAAPIILTVLLTTVLPWNVTSEFERALAPERHSALQNTLLAIYLLIGAAIAEEILLRHYLLNFIAGRTGSRVLAAIVTSAIFALGHAGMIQPVWLKFAQAGVLGIALAVVQFKVGLEGAILTHLLFNVAIASLGVVSLI